MLDNDAMRLLRQAYDPYSPVKESEALAQLGNPSSDEIVEAALAGMRSEDRNVRVLMLRVLKGQSGPKAMQGILAGLNDTKRRVRAVAIGSSVGFHGYPEITDRLRAIALDEHETRRIRRLALDALTGTAGSPAGELTANHIHALHVLAQNDAYRSGLLFRLLLLDLTGPVEELLREFVASGTREEAVMATRGLCGYRVVNLGQFESEQTRAYITHMCELAAGRVWYWVKREQYANLVSGRLPAQKSETEDCSCT